MSDYHVKLDIFAGPLDLLLYLVRKEEVDIYDIPIAKITDQYVQYIEMLKSFDINLAGDFLVMAATLMQIKSAMLLPKADTDSISDDDIDDPRAELIRQLLEYKKFKDAANQLNAAADERQERFGRPNTIVENLTDDTEPELDLEQVTIWDLLEAFDTVCKAIGTVPDISSIKDDTPIDLYQIEILHRLQTEGPFSFQSVFEGRTNRVVMVGLFLSILELVREKLITIEQPTATTLYLRALTDQPAEQAVQSAIFQDEDALDDKEDSSEKPPIIITELPAQKAISEREDEDLPLVAQEPENENQNIDDNIESLTQEQSSEDIETF